MSARTDVEAGAVVQLERGEHHAKGSDVGMTAEPLATRAEVAPRYL